MNYINYTAEELVLDEYFCKWVNGKLPKEDTFWETWIDNNPDKAPIVSQAKFVLKSLEMEHITLADDKLEEKVRDIIESRNGNKFFYKHLWKYASAAVILLSLGLYYIGSKTPDTHSPYDQMVKAQLHPAKEKVNNSNNPMTIGLGDGSVITLQPHSKVSYPETFADDKREVYLSGEAFFDVGKKANQPFLIYANEVVTTVLGTSFSIKAYEKDVDVVVKVVTGRVTVQSRKSDLKSETSSQEESLELVPNQMAIFDRAPEKFRRKLIDNPVIIKSSTKVSKDFNFSNTPLLTVFKTLEEGYGITIIYDFETLKNCAITAPLGNETFYEKLDIICKIIKGSYQVVDAQIVINSKGCNE